MDSQKGGTVNDAYKFLCKPNARQRSYLKRHRVGRRRAEFRRVKQISITHSSFVTAEVMATDFLLNCFVLGDKEDNVFTIEISKNKNFSILKKLIKEEKAPHLNHVAASDLITSKIHKTTMQNIMDTTHLSDYYYLPPTDLQRQLPPLPQTTTKRPLARNAIHAHVSSHSLVTNYHRQPLPLQHTT